MLVGLGMAGISSFIILGLTTVIGFTLLWAFCYAAGDPAEQALVTDLTGGDQRGRAYRFYAMAADLGATFGPFCGAWLYQNVGQGVPFYINGVVFALGTLVLLILLKEPAGQQIPT